MKTSRCLTMCRKGAGDSRKEPFRPLPSMPTLRLQGRWLDEAGFAIGMRVGVQVMPGRLVLETLGPKYVEPDVKRARRSRADVRMACIPQGELERLKQEVSLARLIESQGIVLISQGKDLGCRCPWHEGDDTPSCIVSPKTNLWHCFGCDAGGTVIDWVMRSHKVSFRHACELLLKEHPSLAASGSSSGPVPKLSAGKLRSAQSFQLPTEETDGDQVLLDQVIEFYHQARPPDLLDVLCRL
jgi:CHC2 zinc finger/Toxin SymE, type I toxin-antitoxin system